MNGSYGSQQRKKDVTFPLKYNLLSEVSRIEIFPPNNNSTNCDKSWLLGKCNPQIHVFQLNDDEMMEEIDETDQNEDIVAANTWTLPSESFDGLWERSLLSFPLFLPFFSL